MDAQPITDQHNIHPMAKNQPLKLLKTPCYACRQEYNCPLRVSTYHLTDTDAEAQKQLLDRTWKVGGRIEAPLQR